MSSNKENTNFESVVIVWLLVLSVFVGAMLYGWADFSVKLSNSEAVMKTVDLHRLDKANQEYGRNIAGLQNQTAILEKYMHTHVKK